MLPGENTGLCLVQDNNGPAYMPNYDWLPRCLRERIANSDFNLCAACVCQHYSLELVYQNDDAIASTMKFISDMEYYLRGEDDGQS